MHKVRLQQIIMDTSSLVDGPPAQHLFVTGYGYIIFFHVVMVHMLSY
jgi:hypothetical protein